MRLSGARVILAVAAVVAIVFAVLFGFVHFADLGEPPTTQQGLKGQVMYPSDSASLTVSLP